MKCNGAKVPRPYMKVGGAWSGVALALAEIILWG